MINLVRCVLTNRTKNRLLPIVKKYVNTMDFNRDNDEDDNEEFSIKTRIFSDCFKIYRPVDFYNLGYILNLVNHSVWFGAGMLHTNTIESLCILLNLLPIVLVV